MRTVSTATQAKLGQTHTQPGYLIELAFSTMIRYSTRGDVTWNSKIFAQYDVRVDGIQSDQNGGADARIVVGNTDLSFSALMLNEDPQDKPARIWKFYEGAAALADPVAIFDGVVDSVDFSHQAVTLNLANGNADTLFIPRGRITREAGFLRLSPAGRIIQFAGQKFKLERK